MREIPKITVHFLGASGTVTGSRFLIDTGDYSFMVDCGLFQGLKKLRLLNWEHLPVTASKINAVLLTHGHLDHTGYLPRLVKMGFRGTVFGTKPTLDIARIILMDSAKIQEEEAFTANKMGYSKHSPAVPLYDTADAQKAIAQFKRIETDQWIELHESIRVRFRRVGHIIGATFLEIDALGKRLVFSGDVGRRSDALMDAPARPEKADFVFIESTYGDRIHPTEDQEERILSIVTETVRKGGTLLIPSFAVERSQLLMYLLWNLKKEHRLPDIPMILDSPMGANVLEVFHNNLAWHKLAAEDCKAMCSSFRIVEDFKETWEIIQTSMPKIVIAGSGMVSGGRILSYLTKYIEKPETTILLAGFQAEGTRGRKLLEGADELKIYGKYYLVNAHVEIMETLSSHADREELLDWLSGIKRRPEKVFILHGEPHAADAFRVKIKDTYGWETVIPELYDIVELDTYKKGKNE